MGTFALKIKSKNYSLGNFKMIRTRHPIVVAVASTASFIGMQMFSSLHSGQNLGFSSPAIASYAFQGTSGFQYVPPVGANPRRSRGSGSRGCDQSLPVTVTLLIPSTHIGDTTSSHPTFSWHLSNNVSVPIKFALVELGVVEPLYVQEIASPKAGITEVEIPKDRPELVPGHQYRWSVSLVCNHNRPSANPYFYSWIKRVPTPPALSEKLAATNNPATTLDKAASSKRLRDRAQIYAQAGQWYDALAALTAAKTENPNDPAIREDFFTLLNQGGLTNVVTQERQRTAK
jgi:hypothetical protein